MFLTLNYLNLITSEHRLKPKYIAMLTGVFDLFTDCANAFADISSLLDIDTATGVELDLIGEYIGQRRDLNVTLEGASSVLGDNDYRFLLKTKLIWNTWEGTVGELYDLWETLFPDISLVIRDNQNMTCDLFVFGNLSYIQRQLLTLGYVVPKSSGVKYNFYLLDTVLFSYDLNITYYKGYDVGNWESADSRIFAMDYDNIQSTTYAGLNLGVWEMVNN